MFKYLTMRVKYALLHLEGHMQTFSFLKDHFDEYCRIYSYHRTLAVFYNFIESHYRDLMMNVRQVWFTIKNDT